MTPNTPHFKNDVKDTWGAAAKPVSLEDVQKMYEILREYDTLAKLPYKSYLFNIDPGKPLYQRCVPRWWKDD